MRALQTPINRRLNVALFQLDFGAQLLKTGNMQIDRARADGAAARQRNLPLAEARHQRPQRPNGRAHGFHQFIRGAVNIDLAGVQMHRPIALRFDTQLTQQLHGGIDVLKFWDILNLYRLFSQQSGEQDRQRGIFGAGYGYFTTQPGRTLYTKFIHCNCSLLSILKRLLNRGPCAASTA